MKRKNTGEYALERSSMVTAITKALFGDERITAAWLTGSLARGDEDEFSDVDLCAVISNQRLGIIENWLPFVSTFGEPANVHEARRNAPKGGTMISTLYMNGITIDWMLIPLSVAARPHDSLLIFEKEGIPIQAEASKLTPEEEQAQLNDRLTFFWMIAAVAAKTLLRNHSGRFHEFLNTLFWTAEKIKELKSNQANTQHKYTGLSLFVTRNEQEGALLKVCEQVITLSHKPDEPAFGVVKNLLAMKPAN